MFLRSPRVLRVLLLLAAASPALAAAAATPPATTRPTKFQAGTLREPAITESSGLVASRRHRGVFWTLNDSGNPPVLFAVEVDGTLIRSYPVAATNIDWEDLAIDDAGRLYIADLGNNDGRRREVQVYRVDEPNPRAPVSGRPAPLPVRATWRLTYPAAPFDCESLFVHAGRAYLLPKRIDGSAAEIFSFDLAPPKGPSKLERLCEVPAVRAPVTAADVSADGKRLAILTVLGLYVIDIGGDVAHAATAKAAYSRYIHPNMEAACFTDGGVLVTTEKRDVFFFRDEHLKPATR